MKQRKGWTQAEDEVLRLLKEQRNQIKWSSIARIMQLQFGMPGKTGKQCRQRYQNHLKPAISHTDWRPQEDEILLRLHSEWGNKWSTIAQNLPGRTENCVKNHFYSKLRKVIRKLKRVHAGLSQAVPSPASFSLLSRIIAASECKFKPGSTVSEEWIVFASILVEKLYNFEPEGPQGRVAQEDILSDMVYFEQNFKKRKCNKKNHSETAYSNRINTTNTKKTSNKTPKIFHIKQENPEENNNQPLEKVFKVQGFVPDIFIPSFSVPPSIQNKLVPNRIQMMGSPQSLAVLSEGIMQPLHLSQCVIIKVNTSTFNSFCQFQEWQKLQMLEESEEYAFHYRNELL